MLQSLGSKRSGGGRWGEWGRGGGSGRDRCEEKRDFREEMRDESQQWRRAVGLKRSNS